MANGNFGGGDGSSENPYLVEDAYDLEAIKDTDLSAHYKQIADIDMSDFVYWTPIGTREIPFSGVYDGNGYKFINIDMIFYSKKAEGLFGAIGESEEIIRVILKNNQYFESGDFEPEVVIKNPPGVNGPFVSGASGYPYQTDEIKRILPNGDIQMEDIVIPREELLNEFPEKTFPFIVEGKCVQKEWDYDYWWSMCQGNLYDAYFHETYEISTESHYIEELNSENVILLTLSPEITECIWWG